MSWFREFMGKAEAHASDIELRTQQFFDRGQEKAKDAVADASDATTDVVENHQDYADAWLNRIPGYTGYRDKESRRDSDKALRNQIGIHLDQDAKRIEAVQRDAAGARNAELVNKLEPIVQGFRHDANLVRTLSYGYGGLFSDKPVDETALAQLRLFDEGLLIKSDALSTAVDELIANPDADAAPILLQLAAFGNGLELRSEVISEGRSINPSRTSRPSPFGDESGESAKTSGLPEVALGDAVSVLGDDHIVQALIDVRTGENTQRFVRLDKTPQLWLWLFTDPSRSPLLLKPATEPLDVSYQSMDGPAKVQIAGERTHRGPAVIGTGTTADGSEAVSVDIDGTKQEFTGTVVHADDIETYRAK